MKEEKKFGFITITKRDIIFILAFIAIACIVFGCVFVLRYYNYRKAVNLLEDGEYEKAYEAFHELGDYRDSEEKLAEAKKEIFKNAKVGSKVYFGNYFVGNDKDDMKRDDISWIVLEIKDGKALLITEKNVDYYKWKSGYYSYHELPSWEDSTLRNYLNTQFLKDAFSEEEIKKIADTTVVPDVEDHKDRFADALSNEERVKENETVDKVFVLSYSEAEKCFASDEERKSEPTKYTRKTNRSIEPRLFHSADLAETEVRSWWLRTRIDTTNNENHYICCVTASGRLVRETPSTNHAIRPVIWVSIE